MNFFGFGKTRIPCSVFLQAIAVTIGVAGYTSAQELKVEKVGDNYRISAEGRVIAEQKQEVSDAKISTIANAKVATWSAGSPAADTPIKFYFSIQTDAGWSQPKSTDYLLKLRSRRFDPAVASQIADGADVPKSLRLTKEAQLYYVQFRTQVLPEYRKALESLGCEIRSYVPDFAYVVRIKPDAADGVKALSFVRAIAPVLPSDKLEPQAMVAIRNVNEVDMGKSRYVVIATAKQDRGTMIEGLKGLGAIVPNSEKEIGTMVTVEMTLDQVAKAAALDTVQWIERAKKAENDVDKVRELGGGNFLNTLPEGYTGIGIRGHIMEGIYKDHPDFDTTATRTKPIDIDDSTPDEHGQNTFGQVFGDGKTRTDARGLLPDGQGYYTNNSAIYSSPTGAHGARYQLVQKLINEHKILFQTASWGQPRTIHYDAYSRDLDEIAFELDIPITQSQSNSGNQDSRPQAWAKNVISVGAAYHFDNTNDADDRWNGGASIGPAEDGRVKPDLSSFYDKILTTDGPSGHTEDFGGTSGATPNVAGHVGLCLEMWTNGVFPSVTLPKPATKDYRFENRPHASMVKALLIASATQFELPPSTDLNRFRQGWGRPNLKTLYDLRHKALIVNEADLLKNLERKVYEIKIAAGEPSLRITLAYPDPPGTPAVTDQHRVNNVDLKVIDPNGNVYWGNYGLLNGATSQLGGSPNLKDTVENVFLTNPVPGTWKIDVIADEVVMDGHLATPDLDVAYSLVALGVTP